jgi:hypothetical protein
MDTTFDNASIRVFFSGLTESALAKKTGKSIQKRRAKQWLEEMRKITRKKGLNNSNRLNIMDAEFAACQIAPLGATMTKVFDIAIAAAQRADFIQDATRGSKLAGGYYLDAGDNDEARSHLTKAYKL